MLNWLAFNVDEEIKRRTSLIFLSDNKIKNVQSFKCPSEIIVISGYNSGFNGSRIGAVFHSRPPLATLMRPRLMYSAQAWQWNAQEISNNGAV